MTIPDINVTVQPHNNSAAAKFAQYSSANKDKLTRQVILSTTVNEERNDGTAQAAQRRQP